MKVIQLRIELIGTTSQIWRRLVVPEAITLGKLHRVFQTAMGWNDSHLHEFVIADLHYGNPRFDYGHPMNDEALVRLGRVLADEPAFQYNYDFGDGWDHRVHIEAKREAHPWEHLPLCTAGENACPPDDVGGPPGYEEFRRAIRNPKHEDHERLLTWIGGAFDPAGFDLNRINQQIHKPRP